MSDQAPSPDLTSIPNGSYDFLPLDKVSFGPGSASALGDEVGRLGCERAFFIGCGAVGKQLAAASGVRIAGQGDVGSTRWPTSSDVDRVVQALKSADADVVVTVGGAGAIEMAKASILALARDTGRFLAHVALPTSVTGQEFSPLVSLRDDNTGTWTGSSNPFVTPSLVVLDADLTEDTPDSEWLSGMARALQHAVEIVYSPNHQPASDATALEALRLLAIHGTESISDAPTRRAARQQCLIAAWLATAGVANITLGLSDALSREIGARYQIPEGDVAAVILPRVMAFLLPNTRDRQARIAAALGVAREGRDERALALEAPPAVFELLRAWHRPERLSALGVPEQDLPALAGGRQEILKVLRQAL